ncbi:MAG TPA: ChbG/HpnK family deacetylase [Thermodesulfovibrionales bacterium]|nr:ChbG/HpnK family deacetylase [Thermodesulfovibrionales bacterium]
MKQDGNPPGKKYLVVVADDLGRSSGINRAVAEAHDKGIVTCASIMVGGEAFQEAVQIALDRSGLAVGLHVTLCDGRAVLPHSSIPSLTDAEGYLEKSPARAWIKYTRPALLSQIESEVEAQFDRLAMAGLYPVHVDCHHHLHMHPFIFEVICRQASKRGVSWVRIPVESLPVVLDLRSRSRGMMPFVEWTVFGIVGMLNKRIVMKYGLRTACHVYGLSRTGGIDEEYLLDVLTHITGKVNEFFTHPDISTEAGRREVQALTSAQVRERVAALDITKANYRELSEGTVILDSVWGRM